MLDQRLRRFGPVAAMVLVVLAAGSRLLAVAGEKADLQAVMQGPTVSILDSTRPVLRYRYTGVPFKPYADQLFSPAGVQVLRDSPFDHKHHHALMYAVAVDGVDFWAEFNAQYGQQRQQTLSVISATPHGGVERAGFVQELNWLGPASAKPLLVEQRAIDVLKAADFGATLVQWCCCCRRRRARIRSPSAALTISAWACGSWSRWIAAAVSSTPTTRPARSSTATRC